MSSSYNYIPIPPRVWSRVQSQCTYIVPDSSYNSAYIPITGQTVSQAQADYEMQMFNKGNILQYKGNSSRLTKQQKYSQLAKGFGPNRTKVFATQSQTYTNPNTTGLKRVNSTSYPYPNQIVGAPNNPSGPFQYNVPNPFDCSNNSIQDGGNLVCGTYANPCSGEIIQKGATSATICNPAAASNVPGPSILCWNNNIQTWFPRQRYFMNNSGSKWPEGYKGFVSATTPVTPVLSGNLNSDFSVTLSWTDISNNCVPISSYNIYQDGTFIQSVPYPLTSTTIYNLINKNTYSFYVIGVNNGVQSEPSNNVSVYISDYFATGSYSYSNTTYSGTNYNVVTFTGSGTISFSITTVNTICVGGGGGGGSGEINSAYLVSSGGGGGGGVVSTTLNNITNNLYNILIGNGGVAGTTSGISGFDGSPSYINIGSAHIVTANGGYGGQTGDTVANNRGGNGGASGTPLSTGGAGGYANQTLSPNGLAGTIGGGGGGGCYSGGVGGAGSVNIQVPIYGTAFGAGGGGGSFDNSPGVAGNTNAGNGSYPGATAGNGTANTGGGGGGGGYDNTKLTNPGGNGGSGVVIFYWPV